MRPASLLARFNRWNGALLGLAVGLFDPVLFWLLGANFELDGRDVTWVVGGAFASSTTILGFLLGLTIEGRRREKAAALELSESHARVAQNEKLASLGQLASAIAHEVRNPLAIIRSSVQNLSEIVEDDEDARQQCTFVIDEIDRLTKVTGSLVGFARPLVPKRAPIALADLANRTRVLAGQLLKEPRSPDARDSSRIEFEVNLHDENAVLDADPDLLCQVLLGLLGNAADVMKDGGSVRLESRALEGGGLELSMSDDGPGIPDEIANRVFEPFFTTRAAGSGLGLAVAKQIVEAHEGTISAGPSEAGGAKFSLQFARAA